MDQSGGVGQNLKVETNHTLLAFFRFGRAASLAGKVQKTISNQSFDYCKGLGIAISELRLC